MYDSSYIFPNMPIATPYIQHEDSKTNITAVRLVGHIDEYKH